MSVASSIDDDSVDCVAFFGPGWWPVITEQQYESLLEHIGDWCVQNSLANMDIVVHVSQQDAP